MKEKKDKSVLYIISTIAFIFVGIILTGIIDKTKSNDIRSRAGAISGITATATVSEIDTEKNIIVVDQLIFASSPEKGLGKWTVTPPSTFQLSSITSGNNVNITIDPTTLTVATHTFTAKEIKKK